MRSYTSNRFCYLLFFNIKALYDEKLINLKYSGLFIVDYNLGLFRQYLNNNICRVKNTSTLKYIFYDKSFVKPYVINDIQYLLDLVDMSSRYYFRSHSTINYRLLPGIYRQSELISKEYSIINGVLAEYPRIFADLKKIDVLSEIQHYGGKTRLLDFTENPLVALFFATCSNINKVGKL